MGRAVVTAAEVLDLWWLTVIFVFACVLKLVLSDRQAVGTW